jgi:hypothetical protein
MPVNFSPACWVNICELPSKYSSRLLSKLSKYHGINGVCFLHVNISLLTSLPYKYFMFRQTEYLLITHNIKILTLKSELCHRPDLPD